MTQIKVINRVMYANDKSLEEKVNNWLKTRKNLDIVDIKIVFTEHMIFAIIIYKES